MASPNISPIYNLKVVLRETGLKADTLRAWERRYGLPEPERTPGGHRLYSQYDIETIKWLIERQGEGLRINHAVQLWRDLEATGDDPLQAMPLKSTPSLSTVVGVAPGETILEMRKQWIDACLAFDKSTAEFILAQAFSRYPLETVCIEVLRKGLSEIGNLWYSGDATVQQEHFASALTIRRLDALITAAPPPTHPGNILAACPPEENHIFSAMLITLFLRHRGWRVIYLGANVPLDRLDDTIASTNPILTIMTATQLITAANLYVTGKHLYDSKVPFAYGGSIFNQHPEIRAVIPGHFLGESLDQAVPSIEHILTSQPAIPHPAVVDESYTIAREHFQDRMPFIESHIWESLHTNGIKENHLQIANDYLSRDINAALTLGDMNYLQMELDWIKMLLENHNVPTEQLPEYWGYYNQALKANLDERGRPILNWAENIYKG